MRPLNVGDQVEVLEWDKRWVRAEVTHLEPLDSGPIVVTAQLIGPLQDERLRIIRRYAHEGTRHVSLLELLAEAAA